MGKTGAEAERRATSGVDADVVMLRDAKHLDKACELLWSVWGARDGAERNEVISGVLLRSLAFSGNYVAGVFDGDDIIGCTVGMLGSSEEDGGTDHLHSYIAGVAHTHSDRGIGYRMKRHQREWALSKGLERITWTFDPLVSRNAYFNLCKLGARAVSYKPDFYGRVDDGVNTNQITDRLLVAWDLRAPWVAQSMIGAGRGPRRHAVALPGAELIVVPEDVNMLRESDPERAGRKRLTVRDQFQSLIAQGYQIAGMSRSREYVLLPSEVTPEFTA